MIDRFNVWLALKITSSVSTMWCAYIFMCLALISLPDAIRGGRSTLIAWLAQTFLQLVLLSIIMVGQKVASINSDRRAEETRQLIIDTHTLALSEIESLKDMHQDLHDFLKKEQEYNV